MPRNKTNGLTARERMLLELIKFLKFDINTRTPLNHPDRYLSTREPEVGEVGLCATSGEHEFTIGRVLEKSKEGFGYFLVEDPITGKKCHIHNDSMRVLQNLPYYIFFSESQRIIDDKIYKALAMAGDAWLMRIWRVEFTNDSDVKVTFRPHVWYSETYEMFDITINNVRKSHSIKSIAQKMTDLGITKEWPEEHRKPKGVEHG